MPQPLPLPTAVYDSYWQFAAERQAMYERRLSGASGPWTDNPILRAFRFTNAYRAADRVSQFLIAEIQYREDRSQAPAELFFRTLLFKIFNRIETWTLLERHHGPLAWQSIDLHAVNSTLNQAMASGERIYSAAYIMPPPRLGRQRKHENHLALLEMMMLDGLPARLQRARSLRETYDLLKPYPGLGPFLAFQYAIDLNYSNLLDFNEEDFVVAGPGALDGIAKCFGRDAAKEPEAVIHEMVARQDSEFRRLDLGFNGLFGRRLQPIDCQNLFCEISKFARVAHPEAPGLSGRTRIKQGYRMAPAPLPNPKFPPRWKLTPPPAQCARPAPEQLALFA
jgi:hypothetical protein